MNLSLLYTIGHGNRKAEDLLKLLQTYSIEFLVDTRSQPYSKFNPQYNRNELDYFLQENGIRYVYMGDTLGGRPNDESCYDEHHQLDYKRIKEKDFFRSGIGRLKNASVKSIGLVIMCSESNPCHCHRSHIIAEALKEEGINIKHIDEKGRLKDHEQVMLEINNGHSRHTLFEG